MSPEELAKHKRPSFRPPEPAGSAQTADHVSAADGHQTEEDAVEEEAMDADGLEENDAGAEENTRTQQTPERETLIGGTTQEEPSVEILMAESENTEANMEKSPEEQRYSRRLHVDTGATAASCCHSVRVRKGGFCLGSVCTTLPFIVHQVKMRQTVSPPSISILADSLAQS